MVKNINKVFIILLVLFISVISVQCDKNEDYRDKYLGSFKFTVIITINHLSDSTTTDSSVVYNGKITAGSLSNSIDIRFLQNRSINTILSENGNISKDPISGEGWGVGGQFKSTDEVLFEVFFPGSVADTMYNVTGIRN